MCLARSLFFSVYSVTNTNTPTHSHIQGQTENRNKDLLCVCVCVYLFRQGAAVLLGHAFPHGLLDRFDFLPQRNTRGVGRLDHLTIDCLLVFTLRGRARERERERESERERG